MSTPDGSQSTEPACNWIGGNDIIWCTTCGAEYDYRREEQPLCPQAVAVAAHVYQEVGDEQS